MSPTITITIPVDGNEELISHILATIRGTTDPIKVKVAKKKTKPKITEETVQQELITLEDLNALAGQVAKAKGREPVMTVIANHASTGALKDIPVTSYYQFKEDLELLLVSA